MKKITIFALISFLFASTFAIANEVNIFNARHYKADGELSICFIVSCIEYVDFIRDSKSRSKQK